jgi:hypothetical protein
MKKQFSLIITILLAGLATGTSIAAKDLSELKVLYVGSERTDEFVSFLKPNVAHVESRDRHNFNPADASAFDVVMLDWPQTGGIEEMRSLKSPLGARENWSKPTVLLGSAGLHLAVAWKLKGGTGCTCLSPLAYDLRDHEIFDRPFKIDRAKTVTIPTPPDFKDEIKAPTIEVVPLVRDIDANRMPGWCSYSSDFARNPDVEWFCGGVNHKTPTAGALWRQGNLLHFGFQESPIEMNETGQQLLLNAIVYISRFSQDRPIAITPSVFAGTVARSRNGIKWSLEHAEPRAAEEIAPELWVFLKSMPREKIIQWDADNVKFLHPNSDQQLEIDPDLLALGTPFDAPAFFDKVVAGLRAGGSEAERSRRLLGRYVPAAPKQGSADDCAAWWRENRPYLFASDSSDYCWYIDPLAKQRKVPTSDLRGPKRADTIIAAEAIMTGTSRTEPDTAGTPR